ncbi:MAG: leucine-rich repeat protein [Lachnospiraceae bacterium]|nr:leucine-rich repeat protein [Lachnospiraceae bacterium]
MKRIQLIPVLVLFALAAAVAFFSRTEAVADADTVTVAIAQTNGVRVVTRNPVTVPRGERITFQVQIEDGYLCDGAQEGLFDGTSFSMRADRSKTVYLNTRKYCNITTQAGFGGSLQYNGTQVLEGDTAEVTIKPDLHFEAAKVFVNGREFPAPADNIFRFTVREDSEVTAEFRGQSLSLMVLSNNLGEITISGTDGEYHYGDVVQIEGHSDNPNVHFKGFSTGGYLDEGGTLLTEQAAYECRMEEDTILFANFEDERSFAIRYEANGGTSSITENETHSPEEYVNLRVIDGTIVREGHVLTGFSESADGSGKVHAPGAMIKMPAADLTLYAQWAPETPAQYLNFSTDGGMSVTGLNDAGRAAGLTEIVIPQIAGGTRVTTIGASAFRGVESLTRVIVPPGVTQIGDSAFADNPALREAYLPETLTAIADNAFSGCTSYDRMHVLASLDRAFEYDFDSTLAQKYLRLTSSEGKRIILVGGSGLSFGINSARIQEGFPEYTVVNFSGAANAGILPMLDILRAQVRAEDIVILVPEYYAYMYAGYETHGILNWQYLESNYDMLDDISVQNNPNLFSNYIWYLNEKRSILPGKKQNMKPAYARSGFNQAGDQTAPRANQTGNQLWLPETDAVTDAGCARFNALGQELAKRGARVFFSFPALPHGGLSREELKARTDPFLQMLEGRLDANFVKIISDPADYGFDYTLFFDNHYHMTNEGALVRSAQLVTDLKRALGEGE